MNKLRRREALEGYLFILPGLLGLLIFMVGPIIATVAFSFAEYDLIQPPRFIGAKNFLRLFSDPLFAQSLKVTFTYVILSVPLSTAVALALALLLFQRVKGLAVFRTIFYIPSVLPSIVSAVLWIWLYNPQFGLINYVLKLLGIQGPRWLYDPHWVLPAFAIMGAWNVGPTMIIFLAGLENIPRVYWEAATVDGANAWHRFRYVTLPLLSPTTFFVVVTSTIGAIQTFVQPYVMGGGGVGGLGAPMNATLFSVIYLYQQGFRFFNMGYASAISWVVTTIIILLTLLNFALSRYWVHYSVE